MLQIHAQPSRTITPERVRVAQAVFEAAGFDDDAYQVPEKIDLAKEWILNNLEDLQEILPKYVLGNVAQGLQNEHSRRSLLGFIRRLAQFLEGNVLAKRIQYKKNGRNTCKYMYKIIVWNQKSKNLSFFRPFSEIWIRTRSSLDMDYKSLKKTELEP